MADFSSMIGRERERLAAVRAEVLSRRAAVDQELAVIDREMKALDAYENAKNGPQKRAAGTRTRDGSRKPAIMAIIKQHPDGISPVDVIAKLGAKGDTKAEAAIRAALFQMKKKTEVGNKNGLYMPL
jgi:hypothetical protein